MDRSDALRMVGKLREVRVDRGATPAEARVAAAKAARLEERFGLRAHEARARPAAPSRPRRVWTADSGGGVDLGDFVRTGRPPAGVRVHHWQDRSNWKIEFAPGDTVSVPANSAANWNRGFA